MSTAGLRLAASSSRSAALAASKTTKCSRMQWAARRRLHTRKELPYKIEEGLGNFMSPQTLNMVAVEYQQGLLDRLSEQCRDVDSKRKTIAQIVLDTAKSQDRTLMFRYASHALNNSFFLNCLRPPTADMGETIIERSLLGTAIQKQFGGFDSLRSLFSAAVNGMSGSGYAWLVTDAKKNLAFVPTFAAGTLLIRSGLGTVDSLNTTVLGEGDMFSSPRQNQENPTQPSSPELGQTPSSPVSGISHAPPPLHHSSPARTLHTSAARENLSPRARSVYDPAMPSASFASPHDARDLRTLGEHIFPLFCISVHEHCWLLDHGVWGKERYLKEFWTVVDWDQVVRRFDQFTFTKTW
ncbi:manganese and iron superoxide dismutase [Paxillus ammoniavirescens]|nr:manganese and iron superoxide dismutase [Paxillus ammoniavirescens]